MYFNSTTANRRPNIIIISHHRPHNQSEQSKWPTYLPHLKPMIIKTHAVIKTHLINH